MTQTVPADARDAAPLAPTVSVIIPAYGVNEYIEQAIDSVLAQTYTDFDLYVVNDGAPAAETAELRRILAPYGRLVKYLERVNAGQAAARNTAMRATEAEFVAFLDGDDYWAPELLERQMALFAQDPGLSLVYADARIFGGGPAVGTTYMDTDPSEGAVTLESLLAMRCNVTMSTIVARRRDLIDAGWFDETLRYVEDYDLWLKMTHRGMRFAYRKEPLAFRRVRATSLSSNSLKLDSVALAVLERFAREHELSPRERAEWENRVAWYRSEIGIMQAKAHLASRDYRAAAAALRGIGRERANWKVRLALTGLDTLPWAIGFVFEEWQRFQRSRWARGSGAAPSAPAIGASAPTSVARQ